MGWTGIDVTGGFSWEMRVAADPVKDDAISETTTGKPLQDACSAGDAHEQGNTDVTLTGIATTYADVDPHTGYLLCVRMANDAGSTAWAVPANNGELTTVPGMAPRPDFNSEMSKQDTAGRDGRLGHRDPGRG